MDKVQITIYLSIFGSVFPIEKLTQLLNTNPSSSGTKIIPYPGGGTYNPTKETSWNYEINDRDTYYVEELTNDLLDVFEKKSTIIKDFCKQYDLKSKITIVVIVSGKISPALFFDKRCIDFLYNIEGEIDIDMYING